MDESTKIELLGKLFTSFQNGIRSGKAQKPRAYLKTLGLDFLKLELGFNSGQFHHRQSLEFKKSYEGTGMLTLNPNTGVNKPGLIPYTVFGVYSIVFPLKNEWEEIVNFYAIRFKLDTPKKEYLNQEGVYPCYPKEGTNELFVCDDPLETASLLQAGILEKNQSAISLYDDKVNKTLYEIIEKGAYDRIILVSGHYTTEVYDLLKRDFPKLDLVLIDLREKSINEYLTSNTLYELEEKIKKETAVQNAEVDGEIEFINPQKLRYNGLEGIYEIVGRLSMDLGQLRVSLRIIEKESRKVHRCKIDLFDTQDLQAKISLLSQHFDANKLEVDLVNLTELLENYRDKLYKEELNTNVTGTEDNFKELTPSAKSEAQNFLKQKNLFVAFDKLIELSGIIGEEATRKTAFVIASSYKQPYPMHGLIQASSGKGKSHLINNIASLMPSEDVINLSRITSRSLYNYHNDELMYKLILIQDEDGLDEESLYAFRELQSAGFLSSSTSTKNNFGKHQSRVTRVNAHFSSLMASTKTEIYADNESRSIIIGIDESDEQTLRIIDYSNRVRAGLIEKKSQEKSKQLLRNCIRLLKRKEVINPFAHLIKLPMEAKTLRRLNAQFQDFVSQITILHQFQREEDENGRLVTTKEDMELGINIFFSSILFKVDELDSSTRQLFDRMKRYIKSQKRGIRQEFTRREIREHLNLKKTKAAEFIQHLLEMEFICVSSGSANKGFNYCIVNWDARLVRMKKEIKKAFQEQISQLKRSA